MTAKEQLRKEFDEKYHSFSVEDEHSQFTEGVFIDDVEKMYTFLDQAYDRIREEALREVMGVLLNEMKDTHPETDVGKEVLELLKNLSRAAIQSLITKK